MKPAPFAYSAPDSVEEALSLLAGSEGAKVLAGGQSLLPLLSMRLAAPPRIVDINRLAELAPVSVAAEEVRVGALARHAAVERDAAAYAAQPLLRQALRLVAHPTIRNRGTTVGSIAHADPCGEMTAVLVLLGGTVEAAAIGGVRDIAATHFFVGPLETSLAAGELVRAVRFPVRTPGSGTSFVEAARRHGDYAMAGVASQVVLDDDLRVTAARAAYIAIGATPPVLDLTGTVAGATYDAADWAAAGKAAVAQTDPEADIHASADYRRHLVEVLTARGLAAAARHAAGLEASPVTGVLGGPVAAEQTSTVRLRVNGVLREVTLPVRRLLSDALRHDLRLTGTHVGCEHGVCGACTVLLDGAPVRSCLLLAVSVDGHDVTTVEGLADADGSLHPVQQAFRECHGLQCGFCTPGFLTTIAAYLEEEPDPTPEQAREAISGNLCRCTGYQNIVRSVVRAAEIRRERSMESP